MKRAVFLAALVLLAGGMWQANRAQVGGAGKLGNLRQISKYEFVDVGRVTFLRRSFTVDASAYGGDSEFLVDAFLVVDGTRAPISVEGEAKLVELLAETAAR